MTGSDIKGVLNFSSFRPESDDPSATWRKRFPNRRTLLFGMGKSFLSWRTVDRNGKLGEKEVAQGDPKEILAQNAAQFKDSADGWCAVSLNTRYVISLETNLSRRAGSEDVLKTNPRSILGGRYERGKRYAVTHNPETNSSVLLTCDEEHIRKMEGMFKDAGVNLGRLACGPYVLLRHALSIVNTTKGSEKPTSAFFVVCCEGAVCALVQDQNRWMELRSRTDVYENEIEPAIELLRPFQSRLAPDMEVVVVADDVIPGLHDKVKEVFFGHTVTDHCEPNLLWNLMIQN